MLSSATAIGQGQRQGAHTALTAEPRIAWALHGHHVVLCRCECRVGIAVAYSTDRDGSCVGVCEAKGRRALACLVDALVQLITGTLAHKLRALFDGDE